ncbi:hypothetical protein ACFQ2M_41870 [Kitasatospora saccharophila]|uniref:hypothetical protein n=1 Tax=Kitasatospora saccharophila TaxID=407973 RepID=UPI003639FBA3
MHPNDHMFSFYVRTPSGFSVEYGWGGLLIDDATWYHDRLPLGPPPAGAGSTSLGQRTNHLPERAPMAPSRTTSRSTSARRTGTSGSTRPGRPPVLRRRRSWRHRLEQLLAQHRGAVPPPGDRPRPARLGRLRPVDFATYDHVDAVKLQLLDAMEASSGAAFVGTDGGYTALRLAAERPERGPT